MINNSFNNKPEIVIFTDEFGFQIFKKIISYFNLSKNKILFVFNRKRFCKMKFKFLNFKKYNYFLHSDNNNEFIKKKYVNLELELFVRLIYILKVK